LSYVVNSMACKRPLVSTGKQVRPCRLLPETSGDLLRNRTPVARFDDARTARTSPCTRVVYSWVGCLIVALSGCGTPGKAVSATNSVHDVLGHRKDHTTSTARYRFWEAPSPSDARETDAKPPDPVLATVDGHPINRSRVVDLLMAAYGVGVLEQLIVLDAAQRLAADRGIQVSQRDVAAERRRSLQRLIDPLSAITGEAPGDPEDAERILDRVLADRNVSHAEFDLVLRRNAFLRALVKAEQSFSEEQLRGEFERTHGSRVVVRHIQLPSAAAVTRIEERLAGGEDFAALARVHSANQASARRDGLLEPFARSDEQVPAAFREAAFSLKPGEVSKPVRVGAWYHLIKLERQLPPDPGSFEASRAALTARLSDRTAEPAMRALYEKLFDEARIVIHDPVLRDSFRRVHPGRIR